MYGVSNDLKELNFSVAASEVKLNDSNPREGWVDIGATKHVFSFGGMFTNLEAVENGEHIIMVIQLL